jgi:WD40 repeat protein
MRLSDDEPMFCFHDNRRGFETAHLTISANGDLFGTSTHGSLVCFNMGLLYSNVCPVNLGQPIPSPNQSTVSFAIPDSRSNFKYMLIVTQDNHIIIHNPNPPKHEDQESKSCQGCIKDAHSKKINAVLMDRRKNIIYSAGKDNSIKAWNILSENHKCEFHSFPSYSRFKN